MASCKQNLATVVSIDSNHWFSTRPQRGHEAEPNLEDREKTFYVHCCITFALFGFLMGVVGLWWDAIKQGCANLLLLPAALLSCI